MNFLEWARANGPHARPQTASRWFRQGGLAISGAKAAVGHDLGRCRREPAGQAYRVVRAVSPYARRGDLDRQVARLTTWTTGQGVTVAEVGSRMNDRRPRLTRLLADPQVGTIVVEHLDRLARFGVEQLQYAQGRRILVADPAETTDDLVGGGDDVLTSFCPLLMAVVAPTTGRCVLSSAPNGRPMPPLDPDPVGGDGQDD